MTRGVVALGAAAAAIVLWGLMMRRFGGADVYTAMAPLSLAVIGLVWLLSSGRGGMAARWQTPGATAVRVGIGVGIAMTLATYGLFHLAVAAVPALDAQVDTLYAFVRVERLPVALACTLLIILAEELLWRGFLIDELERWVPRAAAQVLSVVSYALAQLGSGSLVVGALAVACGSLWTLERQLTGSLWAPILSHLIWTPSVILLWPVT